MKKDVVFKDCCHNPGDCLEAFSIYVQCQKTGKWSLIRKSDQHRGNACTIRKDAKAIILKRYTNVADSQ